MKRLVLTTLLLAAAAQATAHRRIEIAMHDSMRYVPERIEVASGETVVLGLANRGAVLHELVIGSAREIEAMRRDRHLAHGSLGMTHVGAGERADLVWRAGAPGELLFACLLPGHYEAGMRGSLTVSDAPADKSPSPAAPPPAR